MFNNHKNKMEPIQITSLLSNILNYPLRSQLIISILKYFIYEKQQMPYSYEHLKKVSSSNKEENGIRERHKISKLKQTFQDFEQIFNELQKELEINNIEEVVLIFGTTILTPKDILRIPVPVATNSLEQYPITKVYFTVLRSLLDSKELDKLLNHQIGLTNIYLFIKVINGCKSEFFLPKESFRISNKCRQAVINMVYSDELIANHEVLSPKKQRDNSSNSDQFSETSNSESASQQPVGIEWYQSKITIKGFK